MVSKPQLHADQSDQTDSMLTMLFKSIYVQNYIFLVYLLNLVYVNLEFNIYQGGLGMYIPTQTWIYLQNLLKNKTE